MRDIDWIEIGTSDFETLIQTAPDSEIGFSVEPLSYYLHRLPTRMNVTKVNCAISFDNTETPIEIYYIPGNIIDKQNLPQMLRGCNSVGKYHYYHKHLNLEHLVVKETVPQIPIAKFLAQHNIRGIKHLKIDTEGGDCYILNNLLDYLKDLTTEYWPKKNYV